ncbi:MAG TPA: DUF2330 domain-containing protein [Polyangiaceae bacterium]
MRSRALKLLSTLGASAAVLAGAPSDAKACGGCFHGPSQNGDVITDHRMIFTITPQATTLYDEIEYSGDPQDFAWVLPIRGPVTVGLSSDVLFQTLDQATRTLIIPPALPACPSCPVCGYGSSGGSSGSSSGGSSGGGAEDAGGVNVIGQQTVGPYDTVQLQSTDPNALNNWLTANGYAVPSSVQSVIDAYVAEGFDFLAMRLQPGQGVSAMRPVRVTSPGAGLSLPLRMVSAGTGPTVGINLWVIGDGRYEPQNFASFIISPSDLVWDWNTDQSNYTTLRAQKEMAANDAAWQIESALQLATLQIETTVLDAQNDYLPIPASDGGADGGASAGETADQVRQDDLATLFPQQGLVWITRMRADLSHAALANDLALQASADQSSLSNIYFVTQSINAPTCPPLPPCVPCTGSSSGGVGVGGNGSGGTSGSSSGGSVGGGDDGGGSGSGFPGIFGSNDGVSASSGQGGGCSTAREDESGSGVPIALGALLAASLVIHRKKGRR